MFSEAVIAKKTGDQKPGCRLLTAIGPDMSLSIEDVSSAAQRLLGKAVTTPLVECHLLSEQINGRVFIKAECLQRTGSFKFRGATNAISHYQEAGGQDPIVACSSGNHAQGIAEAARLHGYPATIIMPSDAPQIKVDRTRRSGAAIEFYDRASEDREVVTDAFIRQHGGYLIHPYNEPLVIAGQGTIGLEIMTQLEQWGLSCDSLITPAGGGGLAAGQALVVKHLSPATRLHLVEPSGFDDYGRSLASGKIETNKQTAGSVCDAILTPAPGERSFEIVSGLGARAHVVKDEEALRAVRYAVHEAKLVIEPGGAAALAHLLNDPAEFANQTVVMIASGGNVDPAMLAGVMTAEISELLS